MPVRITDNNGKTLVTYTWKDGTPTCNCKDDDPPACSDTCVKVITYSAIAGAVIWVCLTRTPPPFPIP